MTFSAVLFYVYAACSVAGAIGLIAARRLVHAVMWLFMTLVSVAGLFLLMGSSLLAGVQLFVYGGAITILMLFVLILSRPSPESVEHPAPSTRWLGVATAIALLVALGYSAAQTALSEADAALPTVDTIALQLFDRYMLPFEIAGLILTIALIGAIALARSESPGGSAGITDPSMPQSGGGDER